MAKKKEKRDDSMGPIQVKVLLMLRKEEFVNALDSAREPFNMPAGGFQTKGQYEKWLPLTYTNKREFQQQIRESAYKLVKQFDLTRNYIDAVVQCLLYGKNLSPKYIGWTMTTYIGKQPIKDENYEGTRMFIEVYPETSIDEINVQWKHHKKDVEKFFGPQDKFRPYDDLLFDLDVYDLYISREKDETVKDVVDKVNKKCKGKRTVTYPQVNKIVHKIRKKIASL